jgi:hypothetical protein
MTLGFIDLKILLKKILLCPVNVLFKENNALSSYHLCLSKIRLCPVKVSVDTKLDFALLK